MKSAMADWKGCCCGTFNPGLKTSSDPVLTRECLGVLLHRTSVRGLYKCHILIMVTSKFTLRHFLRHNWKCSTYNIVFNSGRYYIASYYDTPKYCYYFDRGT